MMFLSGRIKQKRFASVSAWAFYCKTALQAVLLSFSAERAEKLSGSVICLLSE